MNKVKIYWSLQIIGWLSYAFGNFIPFYARGETVSSLAYSTNLFEAFLLLIASHLLRKFIIKRAWLQLPVSKVLWRVVLSIVIISIPIYPLKILFSNLIGLSISINALDFGHILNYTFFLFVWTVFYFSYHYFIRFSESLKYEATMKEIELEHLKSQLNPHFIFNALNSIRALVDENPVKSKNAITQLSNILRYSLVGDKQKLTKFEEELETVKDYLALESTRFEERLSVKFDIHPNSSDYLVPPFMLQTLVENGIKHGIGSLKKGGVIALSTFVEEDLMHIQIRNSGQLNGSTIKNGAGLGLKNTKKRLKLIFGDNSSFEIFNENDHTVLAVVKIPIIKSYESINN